MNPTDGTNGPDAVTGPTPGPATPGWTVTLTAEALTAARTAVARVNRRADRQGWSGRLDLATSPVVTVNTGSPRPFPTLPAGVEVIRWVTTLTGGPLGIGGWTFLAALDTMASDDSGPPRWVIRQTPGTPDIAVDRSALRPGWCDHCRTRRPSRRRLFLVRHLDHGDTRQIGSSCLADFLGHRVLPPFLAAGDALDRAGAIHGAADRFTPTTVVAVTLSLTATYGWVSRSSAAATGRTATASLVTSVLLGRDRSATDLRAAIDQSLPSAHVEAAALVGRLRRRLDQRATGWEGNLAAVLHAEGVGVDQLALTCSAVAAARDDPATPPADRSPAGPPADWLGTVGDPVTVTGTVTHAMTVDGYHPGSSRRLLVLDTPSGPARLYTGAGWAAPVTRGDVVTVSAIVRRHGWYRDTKQTELSRPRLLDKRPGVADGTTVDTGEDSPPP